MLIVHNNEPRLVDIPGPYKKSEDAGGISNEFVIKLKPGANEVDPSQWEKVKGYGVVQDMLKKHPRTGRSHLEVQALKAAEFDSLPQDDALALAEQTLDRELLRKWAASEARGKVKLAIEKQIEKVTVKKPKTVEG